MEPSKIWAKLISLPLWTGVVLGLPLRPLSKEEEPLFGLKERRVTSNSTSAPTAAASPTSSSSDRRTEFGPLLPSSGFSSNESGSHGGACPLLR
ncbi:hypothetical protein FOCC_FOCC011248 [Frankliniella occidentalis]|nr:hypothetical protein FOCC_FOCC011248 [Frankliniella occidentalis]